MEKHIKLGRNDPCWCGSGKKYKNCHWREDEAASSRELRKNRLIQQLDDYALQRRFETDFNAAMRFFYGDKLPVAHSEQEEQAHWQRALDYFIYNYPLANDQRVIERFIAEVGKKLPPEELALVNEWSHSRLSAYEVVELRRGEGLRLRDLVSGDEFDVREKRGTEQVSRWDVVFTRVMKMDDHYEVNAGGLYVPARMRDWLRGYIEELRGDYQFRYPEKEYEDFLRASGQLINQFILNQVQPALQRPPTLVTAEGDLLEQCTATYDMHDYELALAGLRGTIEFVEESEAGETEKSFAWQEKGESLDLLLTHGPDFEHHEAIGADQEGVRNLGHITLNTAELRLDTTSRRRLNAGKELLEKYLGAAIQHVGDEIQSVEEMLSRLSEKEEEGAEEEELPEELEAWQTQIAAQEHYKWLDRPVPLLDDRTPREAVKSLGGRVRVIRLLKEFESVEANRARHGEIPFDVDELKRELGLTEQEFRDESGLEDRLKDELDDIHAQVLEDQVDKALAAWHDWLQKYAVRSLDDLDFSEVWDLADIAEEMVDTLSYRLAMFKRFNEAIALLQDYSHMDVEGADHWQAEIALLRAERGETEQALREFGLLAEREGAEFDALSNWAQVEYDLLNHPDRAVELWQRADEFADEYEASSAYESILQIYLDERRLDEAEHFWHEMNDAEPEADKEYVSWVWIMLARGDIDRARTGAEKITDEVPRNYWRGMVEARAGNFDAARQLWQAELQEPEFDVWGFWAQWAELHLRLHEPDAVLAHVESITRDGRAGAYWAIALAHALKGELTPAAEWAVRARRAMEERERRIHFRSTLGETRSLAQALGLGAARRVLGLE